VSILDPRPQRPIGRGLANVGFPMKHMSVVSKSRKPCAVTDGIKQPKNLGFQEFWQLFEHQRAVLVATFYRCCA
jgi:hypothetical protein